MQRRLILISLAAIALVSLTSAQIIDHSDKTAMNHRLSTGPRDASNPADVLQLNTSLLTLEEVLQQYEREMSSVAQETCDKLTEIARAVREEEMTKEQGEHAVGEAYALGLMRFTMLSTLHEILSNQVAKHADDDSPVLENDPRLARPASIHK
jgi:hypothetical protein